MGWYKAKNKRSGVVQYFTDEPFGDPSLPYTDQKDEFERNPAFKSYKNSIVPVAENEVEQEKVVKNPFKDKGAKATPSAPKNVAKAADTKAAK